MEKLEKVAEVIFVGALETAGIIAMGLGIIALVKHVYCYVLAGCGG